MTETSVKFAALQAMYPTATLHTEGGNPVALIPDAKFRAGGKTAQMTLLLHPHQQGSYPTRLFFEQKLEGIGESKNWTEHTILSRKWWAPSWTGVAASQDWTSMLGAHLRAIA
jgi:hypothetical protein